MGGLGARAHPLTPHFEAQIFATARLRCAMSAKSWLPPYTNPGSAPAGSGAICPITSQVQTVATDSLSDPSSNPRSRCGKIQNLVRAGV